MCTTIAGARENEKKIELIAATLEDAKMIGIAEKTL